MRDDLFMTTRERAAEIAGISIRQVDYWTDAGLVRAAINERLTPGRIVRMYSFRELVALMVAAQLRARKVSLQHIRALVSRVKADGYEQPLTELRWATEGTRLYFQHPDGSWEDGKRPKQTVIREVLDLEELRLRIRERSGRRADAVGRIERRRGAMGSKQVVAGTRVPVATVERYLSSGRSFEEIIASFPALDLRDVEAVAKTMSA